MAHAKMLAVSPSRGHRPNVANTCRLGLSARGVVPMRTFERRRDLAVTIVGERVSVKEIDAVQSAVTGPAKGTVLGTRSLSRPTGQAVEVRCSSETEADVLRSKLPQDPDVGFGFRVPGSSLNPPQLLVMDVDSTLIEEEVIDELAREAGRFEEVARVTARAMNGELDFRGALEARCRALAGLEEHVFSQVLGRLRVRPGAERLLSALKAVGCRRCLVSGGFQQTVGPLAQRLGFDAFHANQLEVVDGVLTGNVTGPIVDAEEKVRFMEAQRAVVDCPRERTLAIGDGANDLPMMRAAGLGIAVLPKPLVREQAPATVPLARLDAAAYHLGWSDDDIDRFAG